ncbi:MAG: chorismate synthase [Deltaproteobacteria bacterium]|nr:chorismate synthase [Deltaproteobacteria bacterium]
MPSNTFGTLFRVTTFGESHGPAIGVVIDGVPSGVALDVKEVQHELDRRRPGQNAVSTPRKEADVVQVLSGLFEGQTTGAPLAMLITNSDARPGAYDHLREIVRPGHADATWQAKFGIRDHRGGGRASGRETATRVAAGAVAKQLLAPLGAKVLAHVAEIGGVCADTFDEAAIEDNIVRCADALAATKMVEAVAAARADGDSLGGIIEVRASGVPAGWGDPVFDKLDAQLAGALLSIGAVKGFELGGGFASARRRGSENNADATSAGGILGGISNGEAIVARVAVKPTSSISQPQQSVDREGKATTLEIKGRHDPCIAPRAVPVVEAMVALVLVDAWLRQRALVGGA